MGLLEQSDIMKAVNSGDLEECKRLIAAGCDVNASDGCTLLGAACQRRDLDLCRLLVEAGADVNDVGGAPLVAAASQGDAEICRYLVSVGADINARAPLMAAASRGFVEVCRMLIDLGADVKAVGADGRTALTMAIRHGKVETVRLLVEAGVPLTNAMESSGYGALTAFQLAVKYDKDEMVHYFLDVCGEDPAQRTIAGKTMMSLAGKNEEVKQLLRAAKASAAVGRSITSEYAAAGATRAVGVSPL